MNIDPASMLMVIFVDLVLSGDNAIVIGLAAAALPAPLRRTAIMWGIGIAIALRIMFALLTLQLLQLTGIKLVGGLMLLWVCFRLWQDLISGASTEPEIAAAGSASEVSEGGGAARAIATAGFMRAMTSIAIADVSMSLDNVLAVAGIAKDNEVTLVFGLGLSILLMALAATAIARTLEHYRWVGYVGLAIILWVAGEMIYNGSQDVYLELLG
ncbi:MAG: YjbE family putative metal transport protein [Geminicoccaceae bacterium]